MHVNINQRWRDRRDSYRPQGETINTQAYEVAQLASDATAKAFVQAHHYSGTYPAARRRFGLYRAGELVGVAVFSQPMSAGVLKGLPGDTQSSVELGRFVLLDNVPGNGETWFLARCFEGLRAEGFAGVVSFSDPTPRTSAGGAAVFGGHVGTIYQASNAVYVGKGTPRTLRMMPDGTVFSDRAAQKIRSRDRGWTYAVEQLVAVGAEAPSEGADLRVWLPEQLKRLTRAVRHHGNHKYLWALNKRDRRHLPQGLAYPKLALGAL